MAVRGLVSSLGLAALCAGANPHGSFGGYTPASNVVEHSQIVQDVKDMTTAVNGGNFAGAKTIWEEGKYSCKSTTKARTLQGFVNAKTVTDKLAGKAFFTSFTSGTGPTGSAGPIPDSGRLGLSTNFWDKFVSDALAQTGDFASASEAMRKVAINKGVLGVVTMYAAYELESAISKAAAGSTGDADGAPHAWDEGWVFYYGNDADGTNSPWEFTKKRDLDYAYKNNVRVSGTVEGKVAVLNYFREGLKASRDGNLAKMVESRDNIYRIWALSAIRAALKYAYKTQSSTYSEAYHMEAYAYFLSAAGWVAQADASAAKNVLNLLDFKKTKDELNSDLYCAVKAELIPVYSKLGLDCEKVGTYKDLPSSKTCASLPNCPSTQAALPTGLSTYVPDVTTTKGSNVDCFPAGTEVAAAHARGLWAAWLTLAIAMAA